MDLLGALGVLVRVVETGSFSAVARERELSQAAVARQISQLEDHFGVRLFHRTTRKLSLTDDGQMLLGLARPVLDGVDTMEGALGKQSVSPVGLVRIGVTVTASRLFSERFPALLAKHPGLKVELVVSDRFGDMIEDRLDLAVRIGEISDASLVVRRLGSGLFVLAAAPSYIERRGRPATPADLASHTCIVHDVGPGSDVWTFTTSEGIRQFKVSGGFLANDVSAVHLAARSGYGIALLPLIQVLDDLRSGNLVCLLNEFPVPGIPFSLVYPSRRHLAPRTRVVFDYIAEQAQQVQAMLASVQEKMRSA
jgi:DNA-binding transcriptional LysR family regulator